MVDEVTAETASARRAREGANALPTPTVVAVETPEPGLRTPRVNVLVALGDCTIRATVRRERRGRLSVSLPLTRDGEPGVILDPTTLAAVEAVVRDAVRADQAAHRYLSQPATPGWVGHKWHPQASSEPKKQIG